MGNYRELTIQKVSVEIQTNDGIEITDGALRLNSSSEHKNVHFQQQISWQLLIDQSKLTNLNKLIPYKKNDETIQRTITVQVNVQIKDKVKKASKTLTEELTIEFVLRPAIMRLGITLP